jgi:hypothetical protein
MGPETALVEVVLGGKTLMHSSVSESMSGLYTRGFFPADLEEVLVLDGLLEVFDLLVGEGSGAVEGWTALVDWFAVGAWVVVMGWVSDEDWVVVAGALAFEIAAIFAATRSWILAFSFARVCLLLDMVAFCFVCRWRLEGWLEKEEEDELYMWLK